MSLVLTYRTDKFAAVGCDGLALEARGDGFIRASEDVPKIWALGPNLVLAAVGLHCLGASLAQTFGRLARENVGDANLFFYLEVGIPLIAKSLVAIRPPRTAEEGLSVSLIGYDAAERRVRCVTWVSAEDFVPRELRERTRVLGYSDAQDVALNLLASGLDDKFDRSPEEARDLLESVVRDTARFVPNFVNDHVRTCVVGVPELNLPPAGEVPPDTGTPVTKQLSAGAGKIADTSGNLVLKNKSTANGTTNAPSTTSATYAVIPEMTLTVTTLGNKVLIIFQASISYSSTTIHARIDFAIFKDSVQLSQDYEFQVNLSGNTSDTNERAVAISYIDSPTAASHTYDVRWKLLDGGTGFAAGTARSIQVVELG